MIHEVVRRVDAPRFDDLFPDRGAYIRRQRQPSLQYFLDPPARGVPGPGEDSESEHDSSEARDAPTSPGLRRRARDDADPACDSDQRQADWARIVKKLRIYAQRLQWRRALHVQALEAGVGVALG